MPINKKCDICDSAPTKLFSIDDEIQGCDAAICLNDGLVFLSPAPTSVEILEYYSEGYDDDFRSEIKNDEPLDSRFRDNFECSYSRFENHLPGTQLSVLDIGSGMGLSIDVFRMHLPSSLFYAVEASAFCRDHLKLSNVQVVSDDFFNNWQRNYAEKFDLIHLRHVFEHLIDPNLALNILYESISPDGILYLCVPDMLNPMKPLRTFWFRSVHSHYFTMKTLSCLLVRNGFSVVDSGTDDSRHEIWVVCKKLSSSQCIKICPLHSLHILIVIYQTLLSEFYKKLKISIKAFIKKILYISK